MLCYREQWYQQLCVLLWVLQAMCMEKVEHMAPLSQCWRVGGPTPSEQTGCRHWELQKQLMHKWQHSIQQVSPAFTPCDTVYSIAAVCVAIVPEERSETLEHQHP